MEMQDFYSDQTVLLTGATGFLGKAIIEKLLRSCQNIKLLLLVRPKKGKNSTQRIQELFNDPIFNRMKSENPGYLDKVTVVGGDVAQPNIGLTDEDRAKIIENVTVVFHGAATVRFDEKLKLAVGINVLGTKQVLELCNQCRNIKAVIHISTAYANCNRKEVKEEFYAPPVPGDSMIQLTECLSEEVLDKCTPMITNGWPNTYAFTKLIAEDVIRAEAEKNSKLPIAVVRPAIVIGSHMEPLPGWIDNIYGPTGVVAGVGAGVMHVMHANSDNIAELVPVDLVVNTVLAAGWDLACNRKKKKNSTEENSTGEIIENCNNNNNNNSRNVPIYNYVSSEHNPLHWGTYMEMNMKHGIMFPSIKSMWYYTIMVTKHLPLFYLYTFFLHLLPAIIIDSVLIATAQKPQALKIYKKIQKFMTVISYFANNEWKFHDDNVQNLWNKLSKRDQAIFNFDIRVINWDRFFENNISAIRVFLFKDTPDTLPAARRKMFLLYILHRTVQIIFWSLLVYFLWSPILSSFKWLFMLSNTVATTVIRSTETSTRQLIVS